MREGYPGCGYDLKTPGLRLTDMTGRCPRTETDGQAPVLLFSGHLKVTGIPSLETSSSEDAKKPYRAEFSMLRSIKSMVDSHTENRQDSGFSYTKTFLF